MKKLIFVLILIACIAGTSLFAWEPNDLTKFPVGQENGDWILNLGVGIPYFDGWHNRYFPPTRLSFDRNTALGDNKLPFFFGGLVGYSGYGRRDDFFVHIIPVGFRFGYHFNWDVKNLDTYAVTTAGMRISFVTGNSHYLNFYDWFMIGVSIGARYFINDFFGFWAEVGYTSFSALDIGISFKF